jgi:hypothetical protein
MAATVTVAARNTQTSERVSIAKEYPLKMN